MSKLIVYGDIHGCYDEFIALRQTINPQHSDLEVCVGDVISKGKHSLKTLDFIIRHTIKSVLGNHEEKLLRYLEHQKSPKKNPIKLTVDEENILASLTKEHIKFLENMPLFLKYGDIVVLHGGLQNKMDLNHLDKRDKEKILRLRYLDPEGHFVSHGCEDENSLFWADIYDGLQGFVVYGHQWFEEVKKSPFALGIDTGCVYGNKLSAAVFSDTHHPQQYTIVSSKESVIQNTDKDNF